MRSGTRQNLRFEPCGAVRYIAEDEFYEAFPDGSERTYDELNRALSALRSGGYIDLKYSRGDMYCVAPLKRYVEEELPVAFVPAEPKRKKFDFVFLSAVIKGLSHCVLVLVRTISDIEHI